MLKYFYSFIIVLLQLNVYAVSPNLENLPENFRKIEGKPLLPNVQFLATKNEYKSIHNLDESIKILHFWATWCTTCVKELPQLSSFIKENKNKVLSISADTGGESMISEYLEKINITNIGTASDPSGIIQKKLNIRGLPTTFIINKEKQVLYIIEGEINWNSEAIRLFLSKM